MLKKGLNFWEEEGAVFFWVLFSDYVGLVFLEYSIPGMVSEILNPQWILLAALLVLLIRQFQKNPKPMVAIPFLQSKGFFLFIGFIFLFLIFVNWLAVGFWTAVVFSLASFLILGYLSRFFSEN